MKDGIESTSPDRDSTILGYYSMVWAKAHELEGGTWLRRATSEIGAIVFVITALGSIIGSATEVMDARYWAIVVSLLLLATTAAYRFVWFLITSPVVIYAEQKSAFRHATSELGAMSTTERRELQLIEAKSFVRATESWLDGELKSPPADISLHKDRVMTVYAGLLKAPLRPIGKPNPTNHEVLLHLRNECMSAVERIKADNYDKNWQPPEWLLELEQLRLNAPIS